MVKKISWGLAAFILSGALAWAGLEDLTGSSKYLNSLVVTNPTATDPKSQGDDHIRGIKNVLLNTFPNITGAVTSTQTELNVLDGITSSTAELNVLDGITSSTTELNLLTGKSGTVWTSANDGSGSGLDADTLDGHDTSYFAASGANSDITSLSGLSTALSLAQGGTAATSASGARTSLGLGSIATQAASSVALTGGTINGTAIGGSTPAAGSFTTGTFSGAVSSTKSCSAGYNRGGPNYCIAAQGGGPSSSLTYSSCTTIAVPSDAKYVDVDINIIPYSAASAGVLRYGDVEAYTTSGCTVQATNTYVHGSIYEFSSVTSGTQLGGLSKSIRVPAYSGNIYLKFYARDAGGLTLSTYSVTGYGD